MPAWLDEASELLTWLTILSILLGGIAVLIRWWTKWLRGVIRDEISEHTYLISPNANGGLSLPDVNRKLDRVMKHLQIEDENV